MEFTIRNERETWPNINEGTRFVIVTVYEVFFFFIFIFRRKSRVFLEACPLINGVYRGNIFQVVLRAVLREFSFNFSFTILSYAARRVGRGHDDDDNVVVSLSSILCGVRTTLSIDADGRLFRSGVARALSFRCRGCLGRAATGVTLFLISPRRTRKRTGGCCSIAVAVEREGRSSSCWSSERRRYLVYFVTCRCFNQGSTTRSNRPRDSVEIGFGFRFRFEQLDDIDTCSPSFLNYREDRL